MLKMAFQAMRAEASAQKAHRALKRACRQRKRAQLLAGLESREEAARKGDSKAFYVLFGLSPLNPTSLSDKSGALLDLESVCHRAVCWSIACASTASAHTRASTWLTGTAKCTVQAQEGKGCSSRSGANLHVAGVVEHSGGETRGDFQGHALQ